MDPSHPALVPSAMGNPLINKLPPEIRSHVYGFVLAERVEVTAHQPGLLQTCRQIRSESKGIFYHDAKFEVTPTSMKGGALRVMGRWLKVVGPENASLITSLTIVPGPGFANAIASLTDERETWTKTAMNVLNCGLCHALLTVDLSGAVALSEILTPQEPAKCMSDRHVVASCLDRFPLMEDESCNHNNNPFSGAHNAALRPWALLAVCHTFVRECHWHGFYDVVGTITGFAKMTGKGKNLLIDVYEKQRV